MLKNSLHKSQISTEIFGGKDLPASARSTLASKLIADCNTGSLLRKDLVFKMIRKALARTRGLLPVPKHALFF